MRCPKCGNSIMVNINHCPNCGSDVSFTTVRTGSSMRNISLSLPKVLPMVVIIPLIYVLGSIGIGFLKVTGQAELVDIILKVIFYTGIILVAINLLIYIKNKGEELNLAHSRQKLEPSKKTFKFSVIWFSLGLAFIFFPFIVKPIVTSVTNLQFINYETVEYVEISGVKMPTLYSVVGKRDITFNIGSGNEYDSEFDVSYETLAMVYDDISNNDIELYKKELTNKGYVLIKIYDKEEDGDIYLYVKNEIELNKFSLINITDRTITYSVASGKYEEKFEGYVVV